MTQNDDPLRKQVLYLLRRGDAHLSFEDFVEICTRKYLTAMVKQFCVKHS